MQEWFSHFLADASSELYEAYQLLRPDYRKAMAVLRAKAKAVVGTGSGDLSVLDVACGNAIATRQVFKGGWVRGKRNIRYVGLDHDKNLLREAHRLWPALVTRHADMATADIHEKFDMILCSFAYHHVPDHDKQLLCKRLLEWSKENTNLLVLEICLSRNQLHKYYTAVKTGLRNSRDRRQCLKFIDWTMSTDSASNGEWKVPISRVKKDFCMAGWALQQSSMVWRPPKLPEGAGCFFLHFKPQMRARL